MFLYFLKGLSLFFGIVCLLFVLTGLFLFFRPSQASRQKGRARQSRAFGGVIELGLFMILLSVLTGSGTLSVIPLACLLQPIN